MTISISGTLYSDEGTTPITAGCTLNISINGAASAGSTTTSVTDGTYTFSGITAAAAAVVTVYIQDGVNTQKAATVTRSTGANMTGIDLYQDHLNIRSDDGTALSTANLNTSDANGATGISAIYSATSTVCTVASGKHLFIMAGQACTLNTGATLTVTAGDLTNRGTLTAGSGSPINVTGNWINSGTFNPANSTVSLKGTGAQTITSAGSSFATVTINGSGGTYTMQDDLTLTGNLNLTAGDLDTSVSNRGLTVAGNWTATSGTFTARSGTVTFNKASGTQTLNGVSGGFYNLTHSGAGTLQLVTSNLTITNTLTNSAGILDLNGLNLNVAGNWSNTATVTASTGVVTLNGAGGTIQTISGTTTFSNLTATCSTARTIKFTDGTTQTVSTALTLQGATGQLLTLGGTSTGGWTIAVPATQTLDHLSVSYSTATGNTAVAGATSTDGGNNVNWTFGGAPASNFNAAWVAHNNRFLSAGVA